MNIHFANKTNREMRRILQYEFGKIGRVYRRINFFHGCNAEVFYTDGYSAIAVVDTNADYAWLSWFAVRSQCRGQGIGHMLLNFLKERYDCIALGCYGHNTTAKYYWLRNGFTVYAEEVRDGEPWVFLKWNK